MYFSMYSVFVSVSSSDLPSVSENLDCEWMLKISNIIFILWAFWIRTSFAWDIWLICTATNMFTNYLRSWIVCMWCVDVLHQHKFTIFHWNTAHISSECLSLCMNCVFWSHSRDRICNWIIWKRRGRIDRHLIVKLCWFVH